MAQNRFYVVGLYDAEVLVTDELHVAQQYSRNEDYVVIDTEVNQTLFNSGHAGNPFPVVNQLPCED